MSRERSSSRWEPENISSFEVRVPTFDQDVLDARMLHLGERGVHQDVVEGNGEQLQGAVCERRRISSSCQSACVVNALV